MITGEFLSADALGPLGRLADLGDLLVLDPRHDIPRVRAEREWIAARFQEADRKAEASRVWLSRARLGGRVGIRRAAFEDWTVEAGKLFLCDQYLRSAEAQLRKRQIQSISPPKDFRWKDTEQVADLLRRVLDASDKEIVDGAVFRILVRKK